MLRFICIGVVVYALFLSFVAVSAFTTFSCNARGECSDEEYSTWCSTCNNQSWVDCSTNVLIMEEGEWICSICDWPYGPEEDCISCQTGGGGGPER